MAFDLRKALLRKDKPASAPLTEFEFTVLVRALKALAADLRVHPVPALDRLAGHGPDAALHWIAAQARLSERAAEARFAQYRADARARLAGERGDPFPIRRG
ncbi:MAG: hypothetical protein RIS94_482 [Pseudomonadota bacterium]